MPHQSAIFHPLRTTRRFTKRVRSNSKGFVKSVFTVRFGAPGQFGGMDVWEIGPDGVKQIKTGSGSPVGEGRKSPHDVVDFIWDEAKEVPGEVTRGFVNAMLWAAWFTARQAEKTGVVGNTDPTPSQPPQI